MSHTKHTGIINFITRSHKTFVDPIPRIKFNAQSYQPSSLLGLGLATLALKIPDLVVG